MKNEPTDQSKSKKKEREPVISIPPNVIESLLIAVSQGNRAGVTNICAEIKGMANAQGYETF